MVRHILLFLVLAIGVAFASSAQSRDGKSREQMNKEVREFKLKFLAQEMDLKEDQRSKFFELYDEMSDKRKECMKDAQAMERKVKRNHNATDAEYKAATEAMNKAKAEDAAIEKSYDAKFAKFLTPKQIYKMKEAENEFRKRVQEMREKRNNRGRTR